MSLTASALDPAPTPTETAAAPVAATQPENDFAKALFGDDFQETPAAEPATQPAATEPVAPPADPAAVPPQNPDPQTPDLDDPAAKYPKPEELKGESEAARAKWGELRGEIAAYAKKAKELEEQLKTTKATPPEDVLKGYEAKLAEKERLLQEHEEKLRLRALEDTLTYRQAVTEPLTAIIESVESIANSYNVDPAKLVDALAEPDREALKNKLAEVTEGIHEMDRVELYRLAADARAIYAQEAKIRESAAVALQEAEAREQQLRERQAAEQAARMRQTVAASFDEVARRMPKDVGELEDLRDTAMESWKTIQENPDAAAFALSAGLVLPRVLAAHKQAELRTQEALAKVRELEQTLATLQKSRPPGYPVPSADAPPAHDDAANSPVFRAMFTD